MADGVTSGQRLGLRKPDLENYRAPIEELSQMYWDYYDKSDKKIEEEKLEFLYGWGVVSVHLQDPIFIEKLRAHGKWRLSTVSAFPNGMTASMSIKDAPESLFQDYLPPFPAELKEKMVEVNLSEIGHSEPKEPAYCSPLPTEDGPVRQYAC